MEPQKCDCKVLWMLLNSPSTFIVCFQKKSVNLVYAEFCLSGTGLVPSKPDKQNLKTLSVMSNFSDFTKVHPHEDCNNKYFLTLMLCLCMVVLVVVSFLLF